MLIYCQLQPEHLYTSIHELIRLAYPTAEISQVLCNHHDIRIVIAVSEDSQYIQMKGEIHSSGDPIIYSEKIPVDSSGESGAKQLKKDIQVFTYRLLGRHLGAGFNPYGILTGVRPVKLIHRMFDQGYSTSAIQNKMEKDFLVDSAKARLLLEVALNNRPYLLEAETARQKVSIYLGIPFCPSRCYYCSFPGAVLNDYEHDVNPFLTALFMEMKAIGEFLQGKGISVQSIYMGGGTPTVLSSADMEKVFEILHQYYISGSTEEITVEAGRPDTLSLEKLSFLQGAGVDRVCINPQTMNDETLIRIGRKHDRKGVVQSVEWARKAGIKKLNMDLIVGLPGEGIQENTYTAKEILQLNPENITVHTLALKRGSTMALMEGKSGIGQRVAEVEKSLDILSSRFTEAGYLPYYLYRQKYMKAGMENTGFTKEGSSCLYNIQVIEERQTIIGMGGGAASKFVNVSDWTLSSFHNPKNPSSYCETVEKLINRKVDKLQALN